MRRSTRIGAAAGGRGQRMSAMIAQHAQRVRQGSDSEDEWKPDEEGAESEADAAFSDDASSEEEMARRRSKTAKATKRKVIDSDDSDEEKPKMRGKMKMKKARRTIQILDVPVKRSAAVERAAAVVKKEVKRNGVDLQHPPKDEMAEAHRRPMKQQKRPNVSSGSSAEARKHIQPSISYSSPANHTLNNFFDEILEWKFFDALRREAQSGHSFSSANDGSEEGEVEVAIEKVPSKFRSYDHYFSVWKPLALEEVQAQTINTITTDHPNPIPITAKGFGATFISKSCKVRVDPKKQSGPGMKRVGGREKLSDLFVNDLVLLSPDTQYFRKGLASSKASHVKLEEGEEAPDDSPPVGFLAIVTSQRGSKEGLTMTILRTGWGALEKEADLYLFKLNNLVTSVREFRALCDCSHYELMPLLLSGEHKQGSMRLDTLGIKYVQWLNRTFNDSQREAIHAAATSEGFTLIKGPPGTGKTTTLKGLLNSLHLREYNRYYNAVLDVARRPDNETAKAWAQVGNEKPHILVTAPSNAAVDNIVAKVIEEGFCDGEGRRYFPKIVRVGRGLSANVRSVGLEDMVDQICSQPLDVLEGHIARLRQEWMVVERDSLFLREQLRQIVAWIERDPAAALVELADAQAQRNAAAAGPSVPPPLDLPSAAPVDPSQMDTDSAIPSPPPPQQYPDSPPPPPSPPGLASPNAASEKNSKPQAGYLPDHEEEEDEEFPTSFEAPPPAWDEQEETFNAEASGKALNAFLDDGSNSEEDEPLPTGASNPDKSEDQEEHDEPFPAPPSAPTEMKPMHPSVEMDGGTGSNTGSACNPISVDDEGDDTPEEDEPLLGQQQANVERHDQINRVASATEGNISMEDMANSPHGAYPSSPPPPPPPLSPPPPPPQSPPPPPPPDFHDDHRPSSPTIIPQSPRYPPSSGSTEDTTEAGPIDYSRYQPYVDCAQRINGCLEKLAEVKLELQRYEFARKAVSEMGGKRSASTRQSLEVSFLDTAHIVFTTLSSAGVAALDASNRYDILVVDEAAQAVELSTIIPMKFGSKQCVLVGDPQQLSATVFSRTSGQSLYERSLFERLESCDHPVHMLRTQYRSHPLISNFPRNYFYEGKLQDGDNVKGDDYTKPYHSLGPAFLPLVFWNLLSSRETTKSVSRMNIGEAELAVNLYLTLKNSCPPDAIAGKVGMITPYSQQMEELRKRFRRALGDRYEQEVEINTVDGFQGREKDIIILSTVRADPKAGVGFLNDIRRMNVALTRAKFACYVIGKENTLRSSKPWAALLDHSYNNHCIVHVENPQCNLLKLKPMEQPSSESTRSRSATPPPMSSHRQHHGPPSQQYHPEPQVSMGPQPSYPPRPTQGNGWRGRGRGNDGGRGGRRSGSQRGGRSNRGRGQGSPMQQFAPPPARGPPMQQFAPGPAQNPQFPPPRGYHPNQAPPGEYPRPPPMNVPMHARTNGPNPNAHPPPGPGYYAPRGPAPAFQAPSMQRPPQQVNGYAMNQPPAYPRPQNAASGRGNVNPRDPRQLNAAPGRGNMNPRDPRQLNAAPGRGNMNLRDPRQLNAAPGRGNVNPRDPRQQAVNGRGRGCSGFGS